MCKSQYYDQSKDHKEVSNTNLGLLNMSSESTIGWAKSSGNSIVHNNDMVGDQMVL